jgi:ribosomal protein S18 acetylase RimI-like enzyme
LIIRLAQLEDLPQVLELIRLSIRLMDDKGVEQWPHTYPNEAIFTQDITKNQLFVSEVKNNITGLVCLSPEVPPEYENVQWKFTVGKINSIHRLAVHPTLKSPSLASKLMAYVEGIARNTGFSMIRLDTYSKNFIANSFYKKMGYQYCGDINLPYKPDKYFCFEKVL